MRTKQSLVCQYLENISRKALEKYQDIVKKYVRGRHGVYALYRKNKLYYVGLASNLRNRLRRHLRDRLAKAWDSFSVYLTVGGEHLHELETLLLRIIDKRGNRKRGKFGKAEDLRKKLRRDFKQAQRAELDDIFGGRGSGGEREESGVEKESGRQPTLARYVKQRMHIRLRYRGRLYVAHVRRDGTISFAKESSEAKRLQGKIFTSPSLAGKAVTGRAVNGWKVWTFEQAPGDWVPLDELRK